MMPATSYMLTVTSCQMMSSGSLTGATVTLALLVTSSPWKSGQFMVCLNVVTIWMYLPLNSLPSCGE